MTRKLKLVSSGLREPPAPGQTPSASGIVPAQPPTDHLPPPADFDEEHAAEWARICASAPHLQEADRNVLEILVSAIVLHREAARNVRKIGPLIKSSKGVPMQNPYLPVKNAQAKLVARYSDALGLSPTSRKRGKFKDKAPLPTFSAFAGLKDRSAF